VIDGMPAIEPTVHGAFRVVFRYLHVHNEGVQIQFD